MDTKEVISWPELHIKLGKSMLTRKIVCGAIQGTFHDEHPQQSLVGATDIS